MRLYEFIAMDAIEQTEVNWEAAYLLADREGAKYCIYFVESIAFISKYHHKQYNPIHKVLPFKETA